MCVGLKWSILPNRCFDKEHDAGPEDAGTIFQSNPEPIARSDTVGWQEMWGMGTTQDDLPKNPQMGLEKEAAIKTISVEYGFERWLHENLISDQDSCQDVGSFGRRNRAGYSPDMLMRSKPRAMKTIKLVEQSIIAIWQEIAQKFNANGKLTRIGD